MTYADDSVNISRGPLPTFSLRMFPRGRLRVSDSPGAKHHASWLSSIAAVALLPVRPRLPSTALKDWCAGFHRTNYSTA